MAEQIGLEATLSLDEWDSNFRKFTGDLSQAGDLVGKTASGMVSQFDKVGKAIATFGGGAILGGAAAVVGGIGAIGVAAFDVSSEVHKAAGAMAASLDLPIEKAQEFAEVAKEVYGNNFASSIEEAAAAVTNVRQTMRLMADDPALQTATENAFRLKDAFGIEVTESVSAAQTLIENFGVTSDEAFDLIAKGFSMGFDRSGDFLDTIGEYSVQFSNGGASAEEFFGILGSGLQGGMLGTDKAADAFKEFRVRIADGSALTADSLKVLGISADEVTAGLAAGTLTAADAFEMVIEGLNNTADPVKRFQAGVGLLGTQFEDLGEQVVLGLELNSDWVDGFEGTAARLDARYNTLGDAFEGVRRKFIIAFTPITDAILGLVNDHLPKIMEKFSGVSAIIEGFLDIITGKVDDSFGTWTDFRTKIFDVFGPDTGKMIGDIAFAISAFINGLRDGESPLSAFSFAMEAAFGEQGKAIADTIKGIVDTIGGFIAKVKEIADPILAVIGDFVSWQDVLTVLGIALTTVIVPAIAGLVAAIGPVVLAIGGAIAAVALMRTAWEENWGGIRDIAEPVMTFIVDHLGEIGAAVAGAGAVFAGIKIAGWFTTLMSTVTTAGPAIIAAISAISLPVVAVGAAVALLAAAWAGNWFGIRDKTAAAVEAIGNTIEEIGAWLTDAGEWIAGLFADWDLSWESIKSTTTTAVSSVTSSIGELRDDWTAKFGEIVDTTTTIAKEIGDAFGPTKTAIQMHLGDALKEVAAFATGNETEFEATRKIWDTAKQDGTQLFAELSNSLRAVLPDWAKNLGAMALNVAESVGSWVASVSTNVDWFAMGSDVLTLLGDGFTSMVDSVDEIIGDLVGDLVRLISNPNVSWYDLAVAALVLVKDGFESMKNTLITKIGEIVQRLLDQFSIDKWVTIGQDIINGILKGINDLKGDLFDKIAELGNLVPQWLRDLWGIGSPSKVFAEIARDAMRGLLVGFESMQNPIYGFMESLANGITNRMIDAGANAASVLTSAASTFLNLGGPQMEALQKWLDDRQAYEQRTGSMLPFTGIYNTVVQQMSAFRENQHLQNSFKQVLDLINAVRDSGADVAAVFKRLNASTGTLNLADYFNLYDFIAPEDQLRIINESVDAINESTKRSLLVAMRGYDTLIAQSRRARLSFEQVEQEFSVNRLTRLELYQKELAQIDANILKAENMLLATGDESQIGTLRILEEARGKQIDSLREYLRQIDELDKKVARVPILNGELGSTSAEQFRRQFIDPIEDVIRTGFLDSSQRQTWLDQYEKNIVRLAIFKEDMEELAAAMRDIGGVVGSSPFAAWIKERRMDPILEQLQDVNLFEEERNRLTEIYLGQQNQLLAFQNRQNQLGYLQDQVELLNGLKQLTVDSGQMARIGDIFAGIRLGSGALADDLLAAESRLLNERVRLTEEYIAQQNRIIALQEKQQRLDFLNKQIGMVQELIDLDNEFGDIVPLADIFKGLNFGPNMPFDQMLTFTERYLDVLNKVAQQQLTDAVTPTMQAANLRTINPLTGAMVPFNPSGRSATVNINGNVTISNGMDLAQFGQFIDQRIDQALN